MKLTGLRFVKVTENQLKINIIIIIMIIIIIIIISDEWINAIS